MSSEDIRENFSQAPPSYSDLKAYTNESPNIPNAPAKSTSGVSGGWVSLCTSIFISVTPLTVLGILSIVYRPGVSDAQFNSHSSTVLLLSTLSVIAALCSLGLVTSTSTTLHARFLVSPSDRSRTPNAPSPQELGILVALLGGETQAIWDALKYLLLPKVNRRDSRHIFWAVYLRFLLLSMSVLIVAATIWLHASTNTSYVETPGSNSSSSNLWGRALAPSCLSGDEDATSATSFEVTLNDPCPSRLDLFMDDSEAYLTATDASQVNQVITIPDADGSIAVLADANATFGSQYIASSLAVQSVCSPISCDWNADNLTYDCQDFSWSGVLTRSVAVNLVSNFSDPTSWIAVAYSNSGAGAFTSFSDSVDATISDNGTALFTALSCSSRVYDVSYSPSGIQSLDPTNSSAIDLVLSPMFPGQRAGYSGFGSGILASAVTSAAVSSASLQDLADSIATAFSRTAVATTAGIATPIPNVADIQGSSSGGLTSSLPEEGVYLLAAADLAHAVIALIVGVLALVWSRNPDVRAMRERLTVRWTATKAFEHPVE